MAVIPTLSFSAITFLSNVFLALGMFRVISADIRTPNEWQLFFVFLACQRKYVYCRKWGMICLIISF